MAFQELLAQRVREVMGKRRELEEKKMFGGLGFLLHGNMCCGVWKEFLILRLGPDQAAVALKKPSVRAFDITGKAMKGWVMVEPEGTERMEALIEWVQQAETFALTLPSKT